MRACHLRLPLNFIALLGPSRKAMSLRLFYCAAVLVPDTLPDTRMEAAPANGIKQGDGIWLILK